MTASASDRPHRVLLQNALHRAATDHVEVIAYIDGDRQFSFQDLENVSRRLAGALTRSGLTRGDRIAVISNNQIEWLQLFFAATRIGIAVVALSPRYRESEIEFMLADSQVKAVFTVSQIDGFDFLLMLNDIAQRLHGLHHVIAIDSDFFAAMTEADEARSLAAYEAATAEVQPDDLAMVIYTSGTTGRPKGCALTHASLLASAAAQAQHTRTRPGDLVQLANPLNHVGGITCGILAQMLAGGTCELVPVFKAKTVLDMIRRNPPAMLVGVPSMMTLLLMHPESQSVDLSSVRLIITGGSNADDTLLARLQQRMPSATVMNLYGLSEASGALAMTPWQCSNDDLMRSIGTTLEGAAVRVIAPDGTQLPAGEIGELQFRGLGVVSDYIGTSAGHGAFDDGWLKTGDLGLVDSRGYITLKGRAKDMYIQGGFNVYPAEVEALIATHPSVLMVAGIGVPDPILGEIGRYFVVAREGSGLTTADVLAHCSGRIADYKLPRELILRDALPLTPAGKIKKAQLRDESK